MDSLSVELQDFKAQDSGFHEQTFLSLESGFPSWGDFKEAWTLGVKYKEMFSYAQRSSYFVGNIRIEKVFIKSKYRRKLHKRC